MAVAKARPVAGLDAGASIFVNAALIIGTRLNEMVEYEPHLADPTAVYELHQMRIGCGAGQKALGESAISAEGGLAPLPAAFRCVATGGPDLLPG